MPSNVLNEAHHMTHEPIAVGRHRYLYLGGLISANVFRCDVADPLKIPDCPLVTAAKDVKNFSGDRRFRAGCPTAICSSATWVRRT